MYIRGSGIGGGETTLPRMLSGDEAKADVAAEVAAVIRRLGMDGVARADDVGRTRWTKRSKVACCSDVSGTCCRTVRSCRDIHSCFHSVVPPTAMRGF